MSEKESRVVIHGFPVLSGRLPREQTKCPCATELADRKQNSIPRLTSVGEDQLGVPTLPQTWYLTSTASCRLLGQLKIANVDDRP